MSVLVALVCLGLFSNEAFSRAVGLINPVVTQTQTSGFQASPQSGPSQFASAAVPAAASSGNPFLVNRAPGVAGTPARLVNAAGTPVKILGNGTNQAAIPISPYGPFQGTFGFGKGSGTNVLGSGYTNHSNVRAGWPYGANTDDGWTIRGVGKDWVKNNSNFAWHPKSLTEHNFHKEDSLTAWESGYQSGVDGQAGITGFDITDGWNVPVLGQNTVNEANRTRFDMQKFEFEKQKEGVYGPVRVKSQGEGFSAPWIGETIRRGIWDDVYKNAGAGGVPGGVWNRQILPNIPFVGKRKK